MCRNVISFLCAHLSLKLILGYTGLKPCGCEEQQDRTDVNLKNDLRLALVCVNLGVVLVVCMRLCASGTLPWLLFLKTKSLSQLTSELSVALNMDSYGPPNL